MPAGIPDHRRVLVIDDEEAHCAIMRRSLESCHPPFAVDTTDSVSDGFERLEREPFALLLLDYSLRETDGLSVLARLAARFPNLPTVLVTGSGSEAIAAKAIKSGAYDYVVKDANYGSLLPLIVRDTLNRHRLKQENRRLQEEVIRKERLATINVFAAGMAHNIRNPLVAIRTFLDLLPGQVNDPEFMREYRATALAEVKRIAGLVDQLVDYARAGGPSLGPVDVGEALGLAVSFLSHESQVRRVEIDTVVEGSLSVEGDFQRLVQAFTAVLLNAMQSYKDSGLVRAEATETAQGVRVRIEDRGLGIAEEHLPHVFDPFFTTQEPNGGLGLGLTIARAIVEQHGGRMGLESRPGAGTKVTVDLPGA